MRLKTKQNPRKQSISLKVCNACGTLEPPGELKKKILVPGSLPRDSELIGLEWNLVLWFKNKKQGF